jgi:hemerythrin-like domain-containing protein
MMPIGPLMIEHRWIERVIANVQLRLDGRSPRKTIDPVYVERVVDFLRTYADRCHHGKEEDILFRDLGGKNLEPAIASTMRRLVTEHEWARTATRRLVAANASLAAGNRDSLQEVRLLLGDLASFYPGHIELEDNSFFRPAMDYFTGDERAAMLEAFAKFDASLIHEKYRRVAEDLQAEP